MVLVASKILKRQDFKKWFDFPTYEVQVYL